LPKLAEERRDQISQRREIDAGGQRRALRAMAVMSERVLGRFSAARFKGCWILDVLRECFK